MAADSVKPRLAIYAPSVKLGFRDLESAGFFHGLAERYDIHWIFRLEAPQELAGDPTIQQHTICDVPNWRYRLWLYDHALTRHRFDQLVVHPDIDYPKTGYSAKSRAIMRFLLRTGLDRLARPLLRTVFRLTAPKLPIDLTQFDGFLFLGSPKDSLLDDLLRAMKRVKVPSALMATNWDNATSKPFIVLPDMMFTWGPQTAALVPDVHGLPAYPVGSSRFEVYETFEELSPAKARTQLGLAEGPRYLLFAGGGLPFAENETLEALATAIDDSGYDIRILYRPHPASWSGHSEDTIPVHRRDMISIDPTLDMGGHDRNDLYPVLFAALDGLATPFSTMVVEAARAKLPSLCIAFDDPSHTDFDWVVNTHNQCHLSILHEFDWPLTCLDRDTLARQANRLVEQVGQGKRVDQARDIFDAIARTGDGGFVARLSATLDERLLKTN